MVCHNCTYFGKTCFELAFRFHSWRLNASQVTENPERTERCALTLPGLRRCPWRRSSLHLTWGWWRPALHSTELRWLWWRPWWSRRPARSPLSWRSPSHPSDWRRYLSQWCYLGDEGEKNNILWDWSLSGTFLKTLKHVTWYTLTLIYFFFYL